MIHAKIPRESTFFFAACQPGGEAFLKAEIARLDAQVKDIANLRAEIEALKARQKSVEDLQIDRNTPVYLLDELAKSNAPITRKLSPETSAMGIMAVPLIGTLSAAFIMGERPHWQDYVAIAFVMAAMAAVLYPPRAASGSHSP